MSLRARFARAFLILAVLPLSGVTLYSYVSSERAYRRAVETEAAGMAADLNARLGSVTRDLGRRFEGLGELPFGALWQGRQRDPNAERKLLADVRTRLGDAAPLVESLEVLPPPPGPMPQPPQAAALPAPAAVPEPPKTVVIAPEPPAPGAEPVPDHWSVKYAHIAEAAKAFGVEMAREAQQAKDDAERDVKAELSEATRAERDAQREKRAKERGEQIAQKVARAAQLATSSFDSDKQEAKRLAAETAALAFREVGEAFAGGARWRMGRGAPSFGYTFRRGGADVGSVRAEMKPEQVMASVFARTPRSKGEIPFAIDGAGKLYAGDKDKARLEGLKLDPGQNERRQGDWMVVTRKDKETGLTLGIARPLGEGLKEIRAAAFKNLLYGLGITGLALVGILPLSRGMTHDIEALTAGVDKLALGDLTARVPVHSQDEIGRLSEAFNRMAADLKTHQEQLLRQERLRKELEMGRRIQAEMLPRQGLVMPFAEAKGVSIPAREVGGDFYNYFVLDHARAALLVGDVSGKGVGAAILMANLQATLRARLPLESDLRALAKHLDFEIDRDTQTTVYLTAFIGVLDGERRTLNYVNAGHNAPFLLRKDGSVEALDSTGRPLGLYPGGDFEERVVPFGDGDSVLLYTDGIVESEDPAGEAFGVERLKQILIAERATGLDGVLARVEEAVRAHRGGLEAADDATLLLLRFGHPAV